MIFHHGMRGLIRIGGDAFGAGDVDERFVVGAVSGFGHGAYGLQFVRRVEQTLISTRNVIVDFNAEYMILFGIPYNLRGVLRSQSIRTDSRVIRPVTLLRTGETGQANTSDQRKELQSDVATSHARA